MTQVIGPPAAPASPAVPEPQAPAENAAVIAPPEAESGPSFIDPALLNDSEAAVVAAFERRQTQSQGAATPASPETDSAPAVAGGEGDVTSPAIPETPPAAIPPVVEQPFPSVGAPIAPAVTAPAVTPPPEAAPPAMPPVVEPSSPVAPTYDPFALPAPPPGPTPTIAQPGQPAPQYDPNQQQQPPAQPFVPGYTPPQIQQMQEVYQWAQGLTPEESNAINQFIQQNRAQQAAPAAAPPVQPYPAQPIQQPGYPAPQQQTAYQPQQPPGFVAPLVSPAPPAPPDFSQIEDPAVAAYLQSQAAYQQQQAQVIAQQAAAIQQFAPALQDTQAIAQAAFQQQQVQQNAAQNQRLDQARWDFATKYQLSSAELDIVEQRLTQSNLVPELVARRNGDVYTGVIDGFETVAWADPAMRPRLLQAQVAPAVADDRETRERAAKLGALAGQAGGVPSNDSIPASPQDRHRGMVAAIEQAMNQQPS